MRNRRRTGSHTRVTGYLIAALVAIGLLASAASAGAHTKVSVKSIPPSFAPAAPSGGPVALAPRVENPAAYRAHKLRAEQRLRRFESRRAAGPATAASRAAAPQPRTTVFGGLNAPGLDATGGSVTPPDTTGAIGPANYMEMVNAEIAVYSRSTLASPPEEALDEPTFVGSSNPTCDGQIQWDQQGQRWLYAALACSEKIVGNQAYFFGWSKTSSPNLSPSNWCRFEVETEHSIEDYPKLGHDNTQIMIGTNSFEDEGEEHYVGSHIWIADKPAPGDESCAVPALVREEGEFTPVPANLADSSANGYVTAIEENMNHLVMYRVGRNGGGESEVLQETKVTVPSFDFPAPVPQPGTSDTIDSSDTRLTQSVAVTDPATGSEGIWTQHTVAGPGGGPAVVTWYELTPGSTAPRQTGSVAGPGGTFAFNGAISPAANGSDAALIYNSGDASHLVDLRARDRHASTAPGAMNEEIALGSSVGADEDFSCGGTSFPCRWGDYAGASPDPTNSSLVWGTGELTTIPADILEDPQWGSRNVALDASLPNLAPLVTTSPASAIGPHGATLNGVLTSEARDTHYRFQYGTTAKYGKTTAEVDAGAEAEGVPVAATIGGLVSGTTYHYRLVATNSVNTSFGADATFKTTGKKPLVCRRGFKKKRVHGKLKCVRVKHHHHHKHHHH